MTQQIAIVGIGKIARDQHVPSIAADERFRLLATVDPHAGLDGVPHFRNLAELLASGLAVDAVAISTPPQVRAPIARKAIAAGLNVLLEKPPTATLGEFADLARHAERAGVTLFSAWHSRFAPKVAEACEWLATRQVVGGTVTWREDVRRWHPGQAWLWAPGGLGVFDPAINAFSILTMLLPDGLAVASARLEVPANAQTPIAARIGLRAGAAPIVVDLDFLQGGPQIWDIKLDTACGHTMQLSEGGARLAIDDEDRGASPNREYAEVYARFAALIAARESDVDVTPLRLVADSLLVAETHRVEPFVE